MMHFQAKVKQKTEAVLQESNIPPVFLSSVTALSAFLHVASEDGESLPTSISKHE